MRNNNGVKIRAYHLGQGECFLIQYRDDKKRNILVDFGAPSNHPKAELSSVANDVRKKSDGKLDAVIITHDHVDRVSGFLQQKEVFDSMKIGRVVINGMCVADEVGELSEALRNCRNLVDPFRKVLAETKTKVDKDFEYRLENNCSSEAQLNYIRSLTSKSKVDYAERSDKSKDFTISDDCSVKINSPVSGLENYDDDYRQNGISTIHSRLDTRLNEASPSAHPMFGRAFKPSHKPSHLSDADFRTLRQKNFILGMSEYGLVEKAIDNSALIFTLNIHSKKLLFAGDITESNWFWMNYCMRCCESDDNCPDCENCKKAKSQWAELDFCKVTSQQLEYDWENEILKLLPAKSKLLLSKHANGETNKLIRNAKKKHGSNLTVINSNPGQLWSDVVV